MAQLLYEPLLDLRDQAEDSDDAAQAITQEPVATIAEG
jgi:hypothetical protein